MPLDRPTPLTSWVTEESKESFGPQSQARGPPRLRGRLATPATPASPPRPPPALSRGYLGASLAPLYPNNPRNGFDAPPLRSDPAPRGKSARGGGGAAANGEAV